MLPRVKNSRWDTRAAQKAIRAPRGFSVPVPFWWVGETPPRSVLHPLLLPGKVPALQLPPWLTPKRLPDLLPRLRHEGYWELRVLTWKTQLALCWRIYLRSCLSLSDFHITSSAIHAPCWRFSDIAALQQNFRHLLFPTACRQYIFQANWVVFPMPLS